jgi:hypothetical protein
MAGIPELERFFRSTAGIEADSGDLHRVHMFVDEKVDAMAFTGRDAARANGRDVIAPHDLPVTACLHERMREFAHVDVADELRTVLRDAPRRPPGDVTFAPETEDVLVDVFGGIALALARSFEILDEELRHPTLEHWSRVFALYRLVL